MKSIIRMNRKCLSAKGVPFQSCFLFRMFYVFLIKCEMTFVLAASLTTLDDVTLTRVGQTQVLGLLRPTDYFTNLGGGRDGIFLIIRHSNVMFSLAVTPPCPTPINVIVKNTMCSFLFSYNKWALLTNITMAKKNYCTKLQEDKHVKTSYEKKRKKT